MLSTVNQKYLVSVFLNLFPGRPQLDGKDQDGEYGYPMTVQYVKYHDHYLLSDKTVYFMIHYTVKLEESLLLVSSGYYLQDF